VSWRRKKRLHELLELVELTAHKDKLVREVSGGMRRRLSLIAALVHDPRLIFLDEPTAGIDPVLRRSFWDYFAELKREERTLFVTTQYVGEAAYCDYVGVMVNGRLLTVDTPLNLRRRALGGDVVELDTETYLSPDALNRLQRQNAVDAADIRRQSGHTLHLVVNDAGVAMPQILDWFQAEEIEVATISEYTPPFDDVFVKLVEEANDDPPQNDSE
jgi:ABC-2 type transport system ATP-binding protein